MIIDIHAHPVLLDVINEDPEDLSFRKQQFGVFKSGRNPIEFEKLLIDDARIDKVVWLPEDYSTQMGRPIVSNEEMEDYIGLIGGNPSRVRSIVLRQQQETFLLLPFLTLK